MGKKKKESEEKKGGGAGKDWWELSQYVPGDKLDIVLWSGGGAAVLFLVLWIIWLIIASGRASSLDEVTKERDEFSEKLSSMSETAVVDEWKTKAEDAKTAQEKAEAEVADLSVRLTLAEEAKAARQKEIEGLNKKKEELQKEAKKTDAVLKRVTADYAGLRRDSGNVDALRKKHERAEQDLAEARKELASLRQKTKLTDKESADAQKALQDVKDEYEKQITELKSDLEARKEQVKDLDTKLAEFPKTPFTEEEAKRRYDEFFDAVASLTDRDERIALRFKAKLALAGTKYERKAHGLWDREKKLKQKDIDTRALAVYKEAKSAVGSHPQAYDENVALWEEALQNVDVANSRYKKTIEKLIKKQLKQKDAAAKKAEEEARKAEEAAAE